MGSRERVRTAGAHAPIDSQRRLPRRRAGSVRHSRKPRDSARHVDCGRRRVQDTRTFLLGPVSSHALQNIVHVPMDANQKQQWIARWQGLSRGWTNFLRAYGGGGGSKAGSWAMATCMGLLAMNWEGEVVGAAAILWSALTGRQLASTFTSSDGPPSIRNKPRGNGGKQYKIG